MPTLNASLASLRELPRADAAPKRPLPQAASTPELPGCRSVAFGRGTGAPGKHGASSRVLGELYDEGLLPVGRHHPDAHVREARARNNATKDVKDGALSTGASLAYATFAAQKNAMLGPDGAPLPGALDPLLHRLGIPTEPAAKLNHARWLRTTTAAPSSPANAPVRHIERAHAPSSLAEAKRLGQLLIDHTLDVGGTWEERWSAHDAALAELALQAGIQCWERGEVLLQIRKFYNSYKRWACTNEMRSSGLSAVMERAARETTSAEAAEARERADASEQRCKDLEGKVAELRAEHFKIKLLRSINTKQLSQSNK